MGSMTRPTWPQPPMSLLHSPVGTMSTPPPPGCWPLGPCPSNGPGRLRSPCRRSPTAWTRAASNGSASSPPIPPRYPPRPPAFVRGCMAGPRPCEARKRGRSEDHWHRLPHWPNPRSCPGPRMPPSWTWWMPYSRPSTGTRSSRWSWPATPTSPWGPRSTSPISSAGGTGSSRTARCSPCPPPTGSSWGPPPSCWWPVTDPPFSAAPSPVPPSGSSGRKGAPCPASSSSPPRTPPSTVGWSTPSSRPSDPSVPNSTCRPSPDWCA